MKHRLTYDKNGTEPKIYDCDFLDNSKCIQKLGQLEDIEQELGIDFITLIKAQTNGFYIKNSFAIKKVNLSDFKFNLVNKEVHRIVASEHYFFKDYGITWALAREELEK